MNGNKPKATAPGCCTRPVRSVKPVIKPIVKIVTKSVR